MTRDESGEIGMWWGIRAYGSNHGSDFDLVNRKDDDNESDLVSPREGTDYRNYGIPIDEIWRDSDDSAWDERWSKQTGDWSEETKRRTSTSQDSHVWDPNSRGRGRTVETQSGGLAVFRAAWMIGS